MGRVSDVQMRREARRGRGEARRGARAARRGTGRQAPQGRVKSTRRFLIGKQGGGVAGETLHVEKRQSSVSAASTYFHLNCGTVVLLRFESTKILAWLRGPICPLVVPITRPSTTASGVSETMLARRRRWCDRTRVLQKQRTRAPHLVGVVVPIVEIIMPLQVEGYLQPPSSASL